ncbi:MAG: D-xylose transport ATP-binding protein XylG, partial [uncultured Blastococcus sp.]
VRTDRSSRGRHPHPGNADPGTARHRQELRRHPGPARRHDEGLPRPGHRAGGRQRSRQEHADQGHRRHPRHRRRGDPLRGPTGVHLRTSRRCHPRHRDRVPGPRPGRQPRRRAEHVPRPGAQERHPARRDLHGAGGAGHAQQAVGPHAEVRAPARVQPLRWAAADRRDRQGGALGVQAGRPRRADRRSRRGPDPSGARPRPAAGRHRARGGLHLAQHGRRLRGVRPRRGALPGPHGRGHPHLAGQPRPGHRAHHGGPVGRHRHRSRRGRGCGGL